jgi:hypothetical protein
MAKNLKVFMRESARTEEIITVPGPPTLLDDKGKVVELEIKVLKNERIRQINDNYRKTSIATDGKGNPYIANGEVVLRVEKDNAKASRHIIAEALVHPDLSDKELMEFFNCHSLVDMPSKVFSKADEFAFVSRAVMVALGIVSAPDNVESQESLLEEAKN